MNATKVNEFYALDLADLIKRKKAIISERRTLEERLNSDKKPNFSISLFYGNDSRELLNKDRDLEHALHQKTEWMIDIIYDTAIQNLEDEIAVVAKQLKENLINATEDKE